MRPDPWQLQLLRSTAPRVLVNIHRQGGKSTTAALLATHMALYYPGALILLLAPTLRQSTELFRKCLGFYRGLRRPVAAEAENRLSLELESGSRIVALPGQEGNIRGFSNVGLLIVDEAARVEDSLFDEVSPMLAVSQGRVLAISTPWGRRGWWYEAWRSPDPWQRYKVEAKECPRIPAPFLEEERRAKGDWLYRQEYCCEFVDKEVQAFATNDVEAMFDGRTEAWDLFA